MPRTLRSLAPAALLLLLLLGLAAPAAYAQDKSLSPAQRSTLDGQERNLTEYEKAIPGLKNTAEVDYMRKRLDTVLDQLKRNRIPDDHARAVAVRDRVEKARAALVALEPKLKEGEAASAAAADVKNYPDYDKDVDWLEGVRKDYGMTNLIDNPERTGELAKAFPQVTTSYSQRFEKYKPLMLAQNKHGMYIKNQFDGAARSVKQFKGNWDKFAPAALKEVPGFIAEALAMGAKGVAEGKPAFFTGGVKQQMEQARARFRVLKAVDPASPNVADLEQQLAAAQAKLDEMASGLKEQIVAGTESPKEQYAGGDKEELRAAIEAEWKKTWPRDEILGVRMAAADWKRDVKWILEGDTWRKVDMSFLYARVVVKTSDKIAAIYVAVVNLDNLSNSKSIGVQTKQGEWVVEEMLAANFK